MGRRTPALQGHVQLSKTRQTDLSPCARATCLFSNCDNKYYLMPPRNEHDHEEKPTLVETGFPGNRGDGTGAMPPTVGQTGRTATVRGLEGSHWGSGLL